MPQKEFHVTFPVKCFSVIGNPYKMGEIPYKAHFLVAFQDIPSSLTDWMGTNPREQNLGSPVAKAIAASIQQNSHDFHLKNRGCLFSAEDLSFSPAAAGAANGTITMTFSSPALHGNIDGGHTLRLILAARETGNIPEQYVEFEVIVGATSILDIAEARNTSVALDMRTMEEMKGSYDVLKATLGDAIIGEDRFFDRVELKMNEQLDEKNAIDVRLLISILLMFNKSLYPTGSGESPKLPGMNEHPVQMYGGKEAALKKYLELGGSAEARDKELMAMSPIFLDILKLWDAIERELPQVNPKKYMRYRFVESRKRPRSIFSNQELEYYVPQSVLFPIVAAFRSIAAIQEDGTYFWVADPFSAWENTKKLLFGTLDDSLKALRGNIASYAKSSNVWSNNYGTVLLYHMRSQI